MTRIVSLTAVGLLFGVVLMFSSFKIGVALASADPAPPLLLDAGAGSASAAPHADQLPDPTKAPGAALDEIKALRHYGWAAAIFGVGIMLLQVIVWIRDTLGSVPLLGKLAAWLAVRKRVVWTASISVGLAAAFNAVMDGGTWYAALLLVGVKLVAMVNFGGEPAPQPQPARVGEAGFAGRGMMILIAIVGLASVAMLEIDLGGCSSSSKDVKTLVSCSEDAAVKALEPTVIQILDAGGPDWKALMHALVLGFGSDEIDCVVQFAKAELVKKYSDAPNSAGAVQRADEWLHRGESSALEHDVPRGAPAVGVRMNPSPASGL